MKASNKLIEFIIKKEGCKFKLYYCPAKKPTIGCGHVILKGEESLMTATLTKEQVMDLLKKDLQNFELQVAHVFGNNLTQAQFDATLDFAFNAGIGNVSKSDFCRLLKEGKIMEAAEALSQWEYQQWYKAPGLKKRRLEEAIMFLDGQYSVFIEDLAKEAKIPYP